MSEISDETPDEYDFRGGVRGKHHRAYQHGYRTRIHKVDGTVEEREYSLPDGAVLLDPDVRAYFPDSEAVHAALRGLISLLPRARG